jgi:ribosomal protein L37E
MKWDENKINDLTRLVKEGNRVKEIAMVMGISESSVHNKMHRLKLIPIFKEIIVCKECGVEFSKYIKQKQTFCSSSCSATYNNKLKTLSVETKEKISNGLKKWNLSKLENERGDKIETSIISKIKVINIKKCRYCGKENPVKQKIICDDCRKRYYAFYRPSCEFSFNIGNFKESFNLDIIKQFGWYSPTNKGNNLNGVSKDHMYSVKDGFINNINPEIIRHPANCELMIHSINNLKNATSSITIEELLLRIVEWDKKYPQFINTY